VSAFLIFSVGAFEVGLKVTFLLQVCKNFCDSTLSADFAGDLTMWKSGAKVHTGFTSAGIKNMLWLDFGLDFLSRVSEPVIFLRPARLRQAFMARFCQELSHRLSAERTGSWLTR
jgi:hypothetical protein